MVWFKNFVQTATEYTSFLRGNMRFWSWAMFRYEKLSIIKIYAVSKVNKLGGWSWTFLNALLNTVPQDFEFLKSDKNWPEAFKVGDYDHTNLKSQ